MDYDPYEFDEEQPEFDEDQYGIYEDQEGLDEYQQEIIDETTDDTFDALDRTDSALNEIESMLDDLPLDTMNGENVVSVEDALTDVRLHMDDLENEFESWKSYKAHPIRVAGIVAALIMSLYVLVKAISRLFSIPKNSKYKKELKNVEDAIRELDKSKIHIRELIKLHKSYEKQLSRGEIKKGTTFYKWYILNHDPNGTQYEYLLETVDEAKKVVTEFSDMIRADYPMVATQLEDVQNRMGNQINGFLRGMRTPNFKPNKKAPGNIEKLGVSALIIIEDFEKTLVKILGGNVKKVQKEMEMSIEDFKQIDKKASKG